MFYQVLISQWTQVGMVIMYNNPMTVLDFSDLMFYFLYLLNDLMPYYDIVRSCNHYALFVIIAQILQNLAFPLFTAIIKTQNQSKLRSTLENAKSNP